MSSCCGPGCVLNKKTPYVRWSGPQTASGDSGHPHHIGNAAEITVHGLQEAGGGNRTRIISLEG
jgi:hypothetical protein